MTNTESAAVRTRHIKSVLRAAGYEARVSSSPTSHYSAQLTRVHGLDPAVLSHTAVYLRGYLGNDAVIRVYVGFVAIHWN
jgi:hypothetical protein